MITLMYNVHGTEMKTKVQKLNASHEKEGSAQTGIHNFKSKLIKDGGFFFRCIPMERSILG
ncbi:hypothetical protein T4C_6 [Trichinella pseudospiralis]|uniref:Uncharacterized protein n=1 Tax=Trichinella pseudospiralis TaxID=6337 RepID=A0A0V1JP14_TRIPS|nr:hypothetical protein T4C_6 [Trichinella pseudospiralis]